MASGCQGGPLKPQDNSDPPIALPVQLQDDVLQKDGFTPIAIPVQLKDELPVVTLIPGRDGCYHLSTL